MNVTVEGRPEEVIQHLVQTGRYASAEAAINDIVLQFDKHQQLRASIEASLSEDDGMTEAEFDAALASTIEELRQEQPSRAERPASPI